MTREMQRKLRKIDREIQQLEIQKARVVDAMTVKVKDVILVHLHEGRYTDIVLKTAYVRPRVNTLGMRTIALH